MKKPGNGTIPHASTLLSNPASPQHSRGGTPRLTPPGYGPGAARAEPPLLTFAPGTARRGLALAALTLAAALALAGARIPDLPLCATLASFGVVVACANAGLDGFHPAHRFGAANSVTLVRAAGAALIGGLALAGGPPAGGAYWLAAFSALLLALDGIDGWLARDLPPGARLLRAAAGASPGRARLAISRLHPTVTSLTPGFAEAMAAAPGFGAVRWDAEEEVEVTTLDALIAREGRPRFIKIDVEGGEDAVLAGLSAPIDWIAFEALPALPGVTERAPEHLDMLGAYRFNFISGEKNRFDLDRWTDAAGIAALLASSGRSGDVYARLGGATRDPGAGAAHG